MVANSSPGQLNDWQSKLHQCFLDSYNENLLLSPFVSPFGADEENVKPEFQYPLLERVKQAIHETSCRSFAIFADAGMGKTTTALNLCAEFWHDISRNSLDASNQTIRYPIYIHLPMVERDGVLSKDILGDFLKNYKTLMFTEAEQQTIRRKPLLLILDGYDEVTQRCNIYDTNQWDHGGYNIKVVVCSRLEAFRFDLLQKNSRREITRLFEVAGSCRLFYQQSFDTNQIRAYLKKFIEKHTDKLKEIYGENSPWSIDPGHYYTALNRHPSLINLCATPLLLYFIVLILPDLSKKQEIQPFLRQFTQTDIFAAVLTRWFEAQAKRLHDDKRLLFLNQEERCKYLSIYAHNLALSRLNQAGRLNESPFSDADTLISTLLEPINDEVELQEAYETEHKQLFMEKGLLSHLRSGCLFRTQMGQQSGLFKFLHRSIAEFLVARAFSKEIKIAYKQYSSLNELEKIHNLKLNAQLIKEQQIIVRLAEHVQSDADLEALLFDMVYRSRVENPSDLSPIHMMAANAMTVLNAANISFSAKNLSRICIPAANLSHGIFESTDLTGANLDGCILVNTWFQNANLSKTSMHHAFFAEQAYISFTQVIRACRISSDLNWVAVASGCSIFLFSYHDDKLIFNKELTGPKDTIEDICFSYDSKLISGASYDSQISVWSTDNPRPFFVFRPIKTVVRPIEIHGNCLTNVIFHPNNNYIYFSDTVGQLFCLSIREKGQTIFTVKLHDNNMITALALNREARLLTSFCEGKRLCFSSATDGRLIKQIDNMQDVTYSMSFSPNDELLALSGKVEFSVWSPVTYEMIFRQEEGTELGIVISSGLVASHRYLLIEKSNSVRFSIDGTQLIRINRARDVQLFSVHEKQIKIANTIRSRSVSSITTFDINIDTNQLLLGGFDKRLYFLNLPVLQYLKYEEQASFRNAKLSWCTNQLFPLVIAGNDHLCTWSIENKSVTASFGKNGVKKDKITVMASNRTGTLLLTGDENASIKIWSMEDKDCINIFTGHKHVIYSLTFCSDEQYFISGGSDSLVCLWSVSQNTSLHIFNGNKQSVNVVVNKPQDGLIISGSSDGSIHFWSYVSKKYYGSIQYENAINSLLFDKEGKYFAWHNNATILVMNILQKNIFTLSIHESPIKKMSFNDNSAYLLSVDLASCVNLWSIKTQSHIQFIGFFPDICDLIWGQFKSNEYFIISTADGILLWELLIDGGVIRAKFCYKSCELPTNFFNADIHLSEMSGSTADLFSQLGSMNTCDGSSNPLSNLDYQVLNAPKALPIMGIGPSCLPDSPEWDEVLEIVNYQEKKKPHSFIEIKLFLEKLFNESTRQVLISECIDKLITEFHEKNALGIQYFNEKQYETAIRIFTEMMDHLIFSEENETIREKIAKLHNNLGDSYREIERYNKAIYFFNCALIFHELSSGIESQVYQNVLRKKEFCEEKCHANAVQLHASGVEHHKAERYTEAISCFQRALKNYQLHFKEQLHPDVAVTHWNLSTDYLKLNNYSKALKHVQEAYRIRLALFGAEHALTQKAKVRLDECSETERISITNASPLTERNSIHIENIGTSVSALPDGNCAFNTFALGLCDLIEREELADIPELYEPFVASLKLTAASRSAFKAWLENNRAPESRQRQLQSILRHIAINFIEQNYEFFYKESYEAILSEAYQSYIRSNEKDDFFCVHTGVVEMFDTIHTQFNNDPDGARARLNDWLENTFKAKYLNTMRQTATTAIEQDKWGGAQEIFALARVFGLNVLFKKAGYRDITDGILEGIIRGVSQDEITLLNRLGLGIQLDGSSFILDVTDTKEQLRHRISSLTEAMQSKILQAFKPRKAAFGIMHEGAHFTYVKLAHATISAGLVRPTEGGNTFFQPVPEATAASIVSQHRPC